MAKERLNMTSMKRQAGWALVAITAMVLGTGGAVLAAGPESKRLTQGKDYIAEERWALAVEELRAAVADKKETRRDEALYWLAHSLNQAGDPSEAVTTIGRLERDHPSSMWVRPAQSLRVAIAVRLHRTDVLWHMVAPPPPPPAPPAPGVPPASAVPPAPLPPPSVSPPPPGPPHMKPPAAPKALPATPKPLPPPTAVPPKPPLPPPMWYTESIGADDDLRVLALGGLLRSEPQKVVPMLGQIALESENPNSAISAVFVLASSSLPEARAAVVKVARQAASEPVQVAAIRDLGRFGGPEVSKDLMSVYVTAQPLVKAQIVKSLGERSEKVALVSIVSSEKDVRIRSRAFTSLGEAGGAAQLAAMYRTASAADKRAIIGGLGLARADAELIRIAQIERTPAGATFRNDALEQLRLLGTPKAVDYLQKIKESR
jgi:hypothetical protein